MSIFNFSKKTPTKMFVSKLSAPKKNSVIAKSGVVSKGIVSTIVTEIAPELIEEGFKVLSSTIAGFTEDYTNQTIVRKNINGDNQNKIFLPERISIVRASFPKDSKDSPCFDGYGEEDDNCKKLDNRKLQIELDIIKSKDGDAFYFQPRSYYYCGKDNKRKKIDEVNLYFAFVTTSENISDYNSVDFQEIIKFKDLEDDYDYSFKIDERSYDTTYQSPWIGSELSKRGAYTILFKIEERRYRQAFAKTINRVYKKHEDELKSKINREIKQQLSR